MSTTPHFVEDFAAAEDRALAVASDNRVAPATRAHYPWFRVAIRVIVDAAFVLWGAATLSFFVLHSLPGSPADMLVTDPEAPQELRDRVIAEYGLDKPLFIQYLVFLAKLARGDLGNSYLLRRPVADVIALEAGSTISLALSALVLSVLIASVAAILTSGRAPFARKVVSFLELTAISVPSFWVGLLLLAAFSYTIPIFPDSGDRGVSTLILPAITVASGLVGTLAQILRQGMEGTLRQPFIVSAFTRGATETSVRVVHAFRHSLLTTVTLSGMFFAFLLGGAVITETIFARPGIGRIMLMAINSKDIPLVIGVVIFCAIAFVVINTIVDLLYPVIDPRLRTLRPLRPERSAR